MIFKDPLSGSLLYGLSFFRNKPDPSQPRGAVQKSLLLLLKKPYFLLFKPIVREALYRFMDDNEAFALQIVYETLGRGLNRSVQFELFERHFILNVPSLRRDPIPGSSLSHLVRTFKTGVMYFWYALLLRKRILFVGRNGEEVGKCVLATPNLVLPLRGFEDLLTPFVALTDIEPIMQASFVAGTSNPMLDNPQYYDVIGRCTDGTFDAAKLTDAGIELTSADKKLVRSVLKGIDKEHRGEKWVRRQFARHMLYFLHGLGVLQSNAAGLSSTTAESGLSSAQESIFSRFHEDPVYLAYREEQRQLEGMDESPALAAFRSLRKAQEEDSDDITQVQMMKLYFSLDRDLIDPDDMTAIASRGGVGVVAAGLSSDSSQIRKYATNILAKLTNCVEGQVDVISPSVLTLVLQRLTDEKQSVVSAATVCVQKISQLYVGAKALCEQDAAIDLLVEAIDSPATPDDQRYCIAVVLRQIYQFFPDRDPPQIDIRKYLLTESHRSDTDDEPRSKAAVAYLDLLTELADMWHMTLPETEVLDKELHRYLQSVRRGDASNQVLVRLYHALSEKPSNCIRFAMMGGVGALYEHGFLTESSLSPRSWEIVAKACRTNVGIKRLLESDILAFALDQLRHSAHPSLHLLYIGCFLESIIQHASVAATMLEAGGAVALVDFVLAHYPTQEHIDEESAPPAPVRESDPPPPPPARTESFEFAQMADEETLRRLAAISVSSLPPPPPPPPTASLPARPSVLTAPEPEAPPEQTWENRDWLFLCLPALRTLRYMYRALAGEGDEPKKRMRRQLSGLGFILDLDVDLEDPDLADAQIALIMLLVSIGSLDISYLDWIIRARDRQREAERATPPATDDDQLRMKPLVRPDAPHLDGATVVHTGYLEKQGRYNRLWKKKWCVLTSESLVHYKLVKEPVDNTAVAGDTSQRLIALASRATGRNVKRVPAEHPDGVIPLRGAELRLRDAVLMDIVTTKKVYKFRVTYSTELRTWAEGIQRAIRGEPPLEQDAASDHSAGSSEAEQGDGSVFSESVRSNATLRRMTKRPTASAGGDPLDAAEVPAKPVLDFGEEEEQEEQEQQEATAARLSTSSMLFRSSEAMRRRRKTSATSAKHATWTFPDESVLP